jgi:hypothetical protein
VYRTRREKAALHAPTARSPLAGKRVTRGSGAKGTRSRHLGDATARCGGSRQSALPGWSSPRRPYLGSFNRGISAVWGQPVKLNCVIGCSCSQPVGCASTRAYLPPSGAQLGRNKCYFPDVLKLLRWQCAFPGCRHRVQDGTIVCQRPTQLGTGKWGSTFSGPPLLLFKSGPVEVWAASSNRLLGQSEAQSASFRAGPGHRSI